jgi:sec-independent protein translocase protein TatB
VFDLGWSEMAVIMLVALVVIGPKDLPRLARSVGQWVAKGRAMARDFQRSLEEMAREAELDDVKREIEKVGRTNIGKSIEKAIDPGGELSKAFNPDSSSKSAAAGSPKAANGAAKPAIAKPDAAAKPDVAADAAAAASKADAKPKAAARPRTAKPKAGETKGAGATKTAAKPKAAAKPRAAGSAKTAAKPRAAAKPKTSQPKTSTAPKPAASETTEAETVAEPH